MNENRRSIAWLLGGLLLAIDSGRPVQCEILFTEVTTEAGLDAEQYVSQTMHGLGVIWVDYDNDEWPDLFAVNGYGEPPHLYHNEGDGTFSSADHLLPSMGPEEQSGAVFADYDNDGDQDIYILVQDEELIAECNCNPADGPANRLLKNYWVENGNQVVAGEPLFRNVATAAGVAGVAFPPFGDDYARRSLSGGWLDYDRDGCIDLYVSQWAIRHGGEQSNMDTLYHNNCDGTFADATSASGVNDGLVPDNLRPTLAFLAAHLDGDLWSDMYAGNVSERADPLPEPPDANCMPNCPIRYYDMLWHNNGDGTFTNVIHNSPGVGDDTGADMGIDVADIDLDGDWDLYITDLWITEHDQPPPGNAFYLGNGDGTWQDNSAEVAGVAGNPNMATTWAANFFDADQDGYEELFVSGNGPTEADWDLLFRNNGDGTFTDIAAAAGLTLSGDGRGAATADYDHDGDLDFVVVELNGHLRLYRNDSQGIGNWIKVKLEAVQSNRSAIGTIGTVLAGGKRLMRQVKGGSSAHSQDDLVVHFGLGTAAIVEELEIAWPSGTVDTLNNVAVNTLHVVREGEIGSAVAIDTVQPLRLARGLSGTMRVTGQGFEGGGSATVVPPGPGVTIDDTTVIDANTVQLSLTIEPDANLGARGLAWTNPSGDQGTKVPAFWVVPAQP